MLQAIFLYLTNRKSQHFGLKNTTYYFLLTEDTSARPLHRFRLFLDPPTAYYLRVIGIQIIYFQASSIFPPSSCPWIWQLYRKAGFLSNWCTFTFTHSAIPQVKGKSGHWKKKKKDCITQCAELLILNKTWDILRKMQNNFFPLFFHPMSATVCS